MSKNAILVLYYNKPNLTTRCLNSVLESSINKEDIFTFDNGSDIAIFNIIRETFSGINHLRSEKNSGFSGGFNNGASRIFNNGYDGILFLTNDTIIYKETFDACINDAERNKTSLIAPCIRYMNNNSEIDSIGGYFDLNSLTLQHYHSYNLPLELKETMDYIPGTAFYIKKDLFYDTQGMDETYHTYWEDVDFSFRARSLGYTFYRSYEAIIDHAVGKTCHKKPIYTTFYFQRNRIRFAKKHLPSEIRNKIKLNMERELKILTERNREKNDIVKLQYIKEISEELSSL